MSKEIYRIEIPIETKDEYSKDIKQAKKGVESLEKSVNKAEVELSGLEKTAGKTGKESEKLGKSADKAGKDVDKLGTSSRSASKGVDQVGSSSGKSEKQVSRFQKVAQKSQRTLQRLTSRGWQVTLRAVDRASRIIRSVGRFASRVTERTYRTTLRALNLAGGVIRGFSRALLSLPTMITVGLGIVGVGKLSSATIGSAMNFEDYGVSMNHWLDGDKKAAAGLMDWMGKKADMTPYTSADIFPAMTGAVNLAGNNSKDIKRLTGMAIDMAALTPGSTVEDAMQAIQNAKMGEMTMMKRFGFNIGKKEMDSMGWKGFMDEIEKRFEGGALALSATARGQINTLKGYMSSQFRSMGDGGLEGIKPRLQAVTQWLMDNEDAWGNWKKTVEKAGRQASEWVFSKLETGFKHLRDNYLENEGFHKLDFEGKISFIMDDINRWWSNKGKPVIQSWWNSTGQPMAEDLGALIGKAMVNGITLAVKEGASTVFGMWGNTRDTAKEHGVFSKETGKSAMGSLGGTALIAGAGSLLLHPILKMVGGLYKGGRGLFRGGKNIFTKATGKGGKAPNVPKSAPIPAQSKGGQTPKGAPKPVIVDRFGNPIKPKPTGVPQPKTNAPKGFKFPKMPKGLTSLTKRLPYIGPAISALSLAGSTKEELPGAVGAIGGGMAGAAGGAALGSIIPGVGNVIGGIIGGIVGAIGGEKIVTWIQSKWDSIKSGAAVAGKWVADKWDSAWKSVKGFGSGIKEGATAAGEWVGEKFGEAKEWISQKWASFSGWFGKNVWQPFKKVGLNTLYFVVGLFDITREWVSDKWSDLSSWFVETVWSPLKKGVEGAALWIIRKTIEAKLWVINKWSDFSSWFTENVWEPVKMGAAGVALWMYQKYLEAKEWIGQTWSTFSNWFDEVVWTPIKEGATQVGEWISEKYDAAKVWISETWGTFSSWFDETVWSPVKEGAAVAGEWISEKYENAKTAVSDAWGSVAGWFETEVFGPIGDFAVSIADTIESAWTTMSEKITGFYDSAKGMYDKAAGWGSAIVTTGKNLGGKIIERGKEALGHATGTNFHPGGPAIVGDGAGSELVILPDGRTWLSPSTDTHVDLPRGTKVLPHNRTMHALNQRQSNVIPFPSNRGKQQTERFTKQYEVPRYAKGIGNVGITPIDYSEGKSGTTIIYGDTHNEFGETHVTIVIEGSGGDIDEEELANKVTEKVAGVLADKIEQVGSNMPVVAG